MNTSQQLPLVITILVAFALLIIGSIAITQKKRRVRYSLLARFDGYSKDSEEVKNEKLANQSRTLSIYLRFAPRWYQLWVRKMLLAAGKFESLSLIEFVNRKIVGLSLSAALLSLVLYSRNSLNLILIGLLFLICLLAPDYTLYTKGLRRAEIIELELPDVIDLMYLSISAGLTFTAALEKVVQYQSGAAVEEFRRVLNEMNFGISRTAAFASLASRTNQTQLKEFAETIINVDISGISLKKVFSEQSHISRERRMARARTRAQQIPVKILAPVILCFLPAMFIVVLGPAVISILTSFKF